MSNRSTYSTEILIDYVDGLLDPATEQRIKAALQGDEKSQAIVAGIQIFYEKEGRDRQALEEFLEAEPSELMQPRSQSQEKGPKVRNLTPWIVRIAVAAAVVVAGIFILGRSENSMELLAQHAEEYYALPVTVRGEESSDELLKAYVKKDFDTVLAIAEDVSSKNPEIQMAVGLSALYQDDFVRAEVEFQELTQGKHRLKQQAHWYLAISKLSQGQKHQAIQLLRDHARTATFKQVEAKKLLACLESE
ncbi:MAG: hypothetical protein HKN32_10165 [Flavobacteriales bacterium]|nr:hypothetical protein [Flavobacteriales bacterium]